MDQPAVRAADVSLVLLAEVEDPSVDEIGGKAASLVRLARAGFRVPDGVVLPASWFSAWWRSDCASSDSIPCGAT